MDKKLDTLILCLQIRIEVQSILITVAFICYASQQLGRVRSLSKQRNSASSRLAEVHGGLTVFPIFIHNNRPEI